MAAAVVMILPRQVFLLAHILGGLSELRTAEPWNQAQNLKSGHSVGQFYTNYSEASNEKGHNLLRANWLWEMARAAGI